MAYGMDHNHQPLAISHQPSLAMTDFTLPELGENITAGDVLRVLVKPGDTLAKDQPVLELETDKATIEVPSSVAGQVKEIKVKAGDKVKVGQAILSVDEGGAAEAAASPPKAEHKPEQKTEPKAEPKPAPAAKSGAAVGANTAAQMPDEPGFEQHVAGEKREMAADKAGPKRAGPEGRQGKPPPRPAGRQSAGNQTRAPARART